MLYIKDVNPHNLITSAYTYAVFECQLEPDLEPYYIEWLYHNKSFKNVNDRNLDGGITVQVHTKRKLKLSTLFIYIL